MAFEIKGKVAIITGGASGIGLSYAKELLKNDLRGVTLADVNAELGDKALADIRDQFGPKRAIFVKTDVTNKNSFEEAFIKTISAFNNIDILINNAGIMNDAIWEEEIAINLNGTIHGVLLALENYLPKYRTGAEGVIVNISSIAGVKESMAVPIYTATKFAVVGLSKAWGCKAHYDRTQVRVLVLCPGVTDTQLISKCSGRSLGSIYDELNNKLLQVLPAQSPDNVALAMVEIIKKARNGTIWVAEDGNEAYEFILPERETFSPK